MTISITLLNHSEEKSVQITYLDRVYDDKGPTDEFKESSSEPAIGPGRFRLVNIHDGRKVVLSEG